MRKEKINDNIETIIHMCSLLSYATLLMTVPLIPLLSKVSTLSTRVCATKRFPNSKAKLAGEKLLKENPKIQCLWQWPRECKTQTDAIKKQVFDDFPDVQRKIRPSTKNGNIIVSTRRNKDEVFKVVRQYRAPVLDCDLKDLNLPDLPEIINNTIEELTIDL